MTLYIVPIVEGQTEQGCVEQLLQRVWRELLCRSERLQVVEPFRGRRGELVHPNGVVLTDTVGKAFVKLKAKAKKDAQAELLILILLDAEGDCPATLAPRLLKVARKALPTEISVCCVLAKRMLENWIVAGASTLAGVNGLPNPLPPRDRYEEINGAAWLNKQRRRENKTQKYKKTVDAAVFIQRMNLQECRENSPSFDKLCRDLEAQLPQAPNEAGPQDQAAPPTIDTGTAL